MLHEIDEKHKRDIFIPRFDPAAVPASTTERVAYHFEAALQLLRDAGQHFDVFLPLSHPVFQHRLMHRGRYYEMTDSSSPKPLKHTVYCDRMEPACQRDMEIEFAERPQVLNHINYQGEPYQKITFLFVRSQPVAKFAAVHADCAVYFTETQTP